MGAIRTESPPLAGFGDKPLFQGVLLRGHTTRHGESCNNDAGVKRDQRRDRSSVARTMSSVRGATGSAGTATSILTTPMDQVLRRNQHSIQAPSRSALTTSNPAARLAGR